MAKNMRVSNPSGLFGESDAWLPLREYCTCPGCNVVWTHLESSDQKADWAYAKKHYSQEVQCMECGLVTESIPKQSLWQTIRGEWRRTVDSPMMASMPRVDQEEER